ncbi:DUF294 nucleotidyltransferase-like domain-containing protein [Sutcliffiella halmapala]|uniref:DUF294 nucleotidyltransferase-like domain-containing protein n=1 Tax=Sutcliffiella halmapala TaxID=79882 RepID=UPI0009956DAC|nr:DUF294 nucleotidyltransferase-like domain-containing protein [Sutcliffiella halmapala]
MQHPLFQNLDPLQQIAILQRCEERTFAHHQILFKANEARVGLYLIKSGTVEVYLPSKTANQHEEVIEIIKQDQLVGLSPFIDFLTKNHNEAAMEEPSQLQVRAIDDVTALFIPFEVLKERWSDQTVHDYLLQASNIGMFKSINLLNAAPKDSLSKIKTSLYSTLDTMLQQQVPILLILDVMNTLFDRLIKRCVDLAIEEMPSKPPSPFCFYLMGSAGRREQFLLTDQDHFLVYEKGTDHQYFSDLADKIVTNLERVGYKKCTGNMMANNPKWRGSLTEWDTRIKEWALYTTNDRLLLAQNFFSHRLLYGDKVIHERFQKNMQHLLTRAKILHFRLSQLERENTIPTLEQPIRAIFRLQRRTIDMKKEILFPYHHSLQILALMNNIIYGTPIEKIEQLYAKKILTKSFQKDLKASITTILDYYVKNRWSQYKAGEPLTSTLILTNLTTREKEELMLSVRLIKELQNYMLSHF